ncbi:carbohydrate ABC transporter permease [Streptomyces griseorubiginosus]|uniref:Trehalose transport system permease protein SugB n=2 Tax=Streptomyces griseorubiginosus TaxID=67304 RepID=A0AAI8KUL6_9ACTN|nr:carbohydrate ABC transporter permease [Streptomyces griseorubiginosus]AYC35981.1 Trehalose transport system permease protein SugB [Streptomyces griseorubiginosus]
MSAVPSELPVQAHRRRGGTSRRSSRRRREPMRVAVLTCLALVWVGIPMWLLVINSAKPYTEASHLSLSLPKRWMLIDNYKYVIEKGNYPQALLNSLIIVVPTIVVVVLLGSMAAWAFARSRRTSMKIVYNLTVLSVLLPPAVLPTVYMLQVVGIDGTRLGYFLVMTGTRLGVVVFLATGFIRAMPQDLEEAAAIDGASRLQIYRVVVLPLLLPVLLVGCIILIITIWNEFFFASFLLHGSDSATLPLALYQFASSSADVAAMRWDLIFAHVVMTSLPVIVAYLFVQRRVVAGLSEGAVKG